jgi:hypothetical protein
VTPRAISVALGHLEVGDPQRVMASGTLRCRAEPAHRSCPAFFCSDDVDEPQADAASFRSLTVMSAKERDAALAASSLAFLLSDCRRSSNDTASIHRDRMLFDVFLIFGRKAMPCGDTVEFAVT